MQFLNSIGLGGTWDCFVTSTKLMLTPESVDHNLTDRILNETVLSSLK